MGRTLAIDWGRKRVGVALSDPEGLLASPYDTLPAKPRSRLMEAIGRIVKKENVERIIVGLPLNMNGTEGRSVEEARALVVQIGALDIPVEMIDERLTSWEAEKRLIASGRKPSRDKARIDRAAAAILLQSYLDNRREG